MSAYPTSRPSVRPPVLPELVKLDGARLCSVSEPEGPGDDPSALGLPAPEADGLIWLLGARFICSPTGDALTEDVRNTGQTDDGEWYKPALVPFTVKGVSSDSQESGED